MTSVASSDIWKQSWQSTHDHRRLRADGWMDAALVGSVVCLIFQKCSLVDQLQWTPSFRSKKILVLPKIYRLIPCLSTGGIQRLKSLPACAIIHTCVCLLHFSWDAAAPLDPSCPSSAPRWHFWQHKSPLQRFPGLSYFTVLQWLSHDKSNSPRRACEYRP